MSSYDFMRPLSFASLLFLSMLWAQSPLGTVTGVALDPASAPVGNAEVSLKNLDTGLTRQTKTSDSGSYTFPNLSPGNYQINAAANGFKRLEVTTFTVAAFRTIRQDLKLEIAAAASEVTVTEAASPVIQRESPAITNSLNNRQIIELPTNLRSVFNNSGDSGLIFQIMPLTVPGVLQVGAGANFLVPGSQPNGVKLKVDGIETNFGNFGSPDPVSQPSLESVEEFTANISTAKAEFGGFGTITTVTKAGSNALHGSVFWYVRNSAFDARNAFAVAKPFQNIHNYGASVGGPIKKDKTFFYFTFDGTRGSRAYLFTSNVPTAAQRTGDFTGAAALRNPYTGISPFNGNRILPQYLSPQALRAQQAFFPAPNFGAADLAVGNYRAAFNGPEVHRIVEVRLDQNWTSRHSNFLRYQNKQSDYDIPGARSTLPPQSVGTSNNTRRVHFFTVGDTFTLSPNVYNEARAGVIVLVSQSDAALRGQPLIDSFGIAGLPRRDVKGIPNISAAGLSTVTQTLLNPVNDGHAQAADNLTWVRGRHTMKFGVEYINWFVNRYLPTETALFGNFNFTGQFTGSAYADFLLGLPTQVTRLDPYPTQYNRWFDLSGYAQDDWKITPRLTLSYGLRYEFNQPVKANDGNLYSFDPASGAVVVPNDQSRRLFSPYFPSTVPLVTAGSLGISERLRDSDHNNFAPRFGFSYLLDAAGRTVLRGGWGIYYNHYSGAVAATLASGPYSVSTTANNSFINGAPVFTFDSPFAAPGTSGTLNLNAISPRLRNSYAQEMSLSLERELTRTLGLRVSYLGTQGRQLVYGRNLNQPQPSTTPFSASRRPYPIYNAVNYYDNGANNSYNSLQVQVTQRFRRGLFFSSAWTWAKQLSEVDDGNGNADLNTVIENAYDRRRDRADAYPVPRHQWLNQALYELPFGTGKVRGGWQLNLLIDLQTGNYLNPQIAGTNPSNTGITGGRPDVTGPVTYPETIGAWFDRAVYTVPQPGRFGNAARNSIVGPGFFLMNAGISKTTRIERIGEIQLAASFQNVLNHVNLGQPNTTVTTAAGGTITSTHIFPAAGAPRTGQLSLRLNF